MKLDLAKVRHPRERAVLWMSVLTNVGVIAGVAAVAYLAPEWIAAYGRVSGLIDRVRLAAVAVILLLPVLALLRRGRCAAIAEASVRLGRDQVPEIHAILERHCRALEVEPPELYASTIDLVGLSTSVALRGGRRIVVLGPGLFAGLERIRDRADVLGFVLAHELGRLALGHAAWWDALLLGYLKRIPILRAPLLTVQTVSRDRFAATLSPTAIRGLVLVAAGGDLLDHVDVAAFVRQAIHDDTPRWAARLGAMGRDAPHVARRVRELHRAGFLDLERDLAFRTADLPAGQASTEGALDDRAHPPMPH